MADCKGVMTVTGHRPPLSVADRLRRGGAAGSHPLLLLWGVVSSQTRVMLRWGCPALTPREGGAAFLGRCQGRIGARRCCWTWER
ncbi:hypothetical protein GCM10009800_40190 [Nocardiopsis rhodophaea]